MASNSPNICGRYSPNNNCFCVLHEKFQNDLDHFIEHDRLVVTRDIRLLLSSSDAAVGKLAKAKVADKIFTYLTKHKKFLSLNTKFKDTVYNKLLEFEDHTDVFDSQKYIAKLLPDKYDSSKDKPIVSSKGYCDEEAEDSGKFTVTI